MPLLSFRVANLSRWEPRNEVYNNLGDILSFRLGGVLVAALFDAKADTYDDFCLTPLGHFIDTVEKQILGKVAHPLPGELALDLGCGTGSYSLWLQEQGLSVTGVDLSEGMLAVARRKAGNRVQFIEADLAHLPFPAGRFDLAICNVALEFVHDPEAVLREGIRVLKPGGRLVVGLIAGLGPWAAKYSKRGREDPTSVYHSARFLSLDAVQQLGPGSPSAVQFGLYVSPDEFKDEDSAWIMERQRNATQQEAGAGYGRALE